MGLIMNCKYYECDYNCKDCPMFQPAGEDDYPYKCPYCNNATEFNLKQNGPHMSLYCSRCGRWIKHMPKSKVKSEPEVHQISMDEYLAELNYDEDDDLPWY